MTNKNITTGGFLTLAFAGAFAGIPYGAGYAQAKLAPEATTAHISTLEAECRASITIHDKATCLVLDGIQLARN